MDIIDTLLFLGIFAMYIYAVIKKYNIGKEEGYRQGQIDAINGKFKYKQVNVVGYEEVGE